MTTTAPAPISPTQTPDEQAEAAQAQLAAAAAAWSDPHYIKASAILALIALSKVANEVWNAAAVPTLQGRRCYLEEAAKRMEAVLPLLRPCPTHIIIREIDTNVNELVNLIESAQLSDLYELSEERWALHLIAKIAVALIEEAPSAIIDDSARAGLERIAESERGEEMEMVAHYLSDIDDDLDDESLGAIVGLHGAIEGRVPAVACEVRQRDGGGHKEVVVAAAPWASLITQARDDIFAAALNMDNPSINFDIDDLPIPDAETALDEAVAQIGKGLPFETLARLTAYTCWPWCERSEIMGVGKWRIVGGPDVNSTERVTASVLNMLARVEMGGSKRSFGLYTQETAEHTEEVLRLIKLAHDDLAEKVAAFRASIKIGDGAQMEAAANAMTTALVRHGIVTTEDAWLFDDELTVEILDALGVILSDRDDLSDEAGEGRKSAWRTLPPTAHVEIVRRAVLNLSLQKDDDVPW